MKSAARETNQDRSLIKVDKFRSNDNAIQKMMLEADKKGKAEARAKLKYESGKSPEEGLVALQEHHHWIANVYHKDNELIQSFINKIVERGGIPTRVYRYELSPAICSYNEKKDKWSYSQPRTRRTFQKIFPKQFGNSIEGDVMRMTYGTTEERYRYDGSNWISTLEQ